MGNMQKSFGFTLIELLITLSVVALTAMVSGPAISDWVPSNRFVGDVQEVKSRLLLARLEAIKRTQPVSVRFVNAEPESLTVFLDSDDDGIVDAGEALSNYTMDPALNFGRDAGVAIFPAPSIDLSGTVVVFQADGSLRNTAGSSVSGQVYMCFDPANVDVDPSLYRTYAVTASTAGAIDIRKWKDGAWD